MAKRATGRESLLKFESENQAPERNRPVNSSPGSGEALLPRARALARLRPVVVLDTLGNGDSDKPDVGRHPQFRAPQIADYARTVLAALDDLGLGQVDVYGTHTGALIALEAALHDERRVRAVLLDGISLFTAAEVESAMSLQFLDLTPRWDGTQLLAAWSLVRDSRFWYPWYLRDAAHRAAFLVRQDDPFTHKSRGRTVIRRRLRAIGCRYPCLS